MPRFALGRVRVAVEDDRLSLGVKRCLAHLMPLLGSLLESRRFAATVLQCLTANDFSRSVRLGAVECDEYGVELPPKVLQRHGLGDRKTWYVKLALGPGPNGEQVHLVSLHALERPMRRRGGRLTPTW